jgi:hypothetical protein
VEAPRQQESAPVPQPEAINRRLGDTGTLPNTGRRPRMEAAGRANPTPRLNNAGNVPHFIKAMQAR